MDETLLHGRYEDYDHENFNPTFSIEKISVQYRPYLKEFLNQCFEWFDVAIWTNASSCYAKPTINNICELDKFIFFWTRNRCTTIIDKTTYLRISIKDLRKVRRLKYKNENIIVVDDKHYVWQRSYGNLVKIKPYIGGNEDIELKFLIEYLDYLRNVKDIRKINKLHWRKEFNGRDI